MANPGEYVYWLHLMMRKPGHAVLEAERDYKPCAKPGPYRVYMGPDGPCCPGCDRVCRIPPALGLVKDDKIVVCAPKTPQKRGHA